MTVEIDLSGRRAVVTGGGRGIGRAVAVALAEAGADVTVAARTASELDRTVAEIEAHGVDGRSVVADLATDEGLDRLASEAIETERPPDVLVNNAGVFLTASPIDQPVAEIDRMLQLNLRAALLLARRFAATFRASDHDSGRVVNVASNVTRTAVPEWTAYGATKTGLVGVTEGLALELAGDGLTVNSVSPGTTRTPAVEQAIEEFGDQLYDFDRLPTGRIAEPEDVAGVVLFLASDLAGYVTGEDVAVDGGVNVTSGFYK
jgi:NAD(P)-dependent dehydrogenase (short-subunit alcohol dehydrogenase family)